MNEEIVTESKTMHTPGPWRLKDGDTVRQPWAIEGGEGWTVAVVHWNEHMDFDPEANARLIAAAPDLLSESRELVACLVSLYQAGYMDEPTLNSYARLQNAIAKAEGAQ